MGLKEKEMPRRIFEVVSFCRHRVKLQAAKKNELCLCKLGPSREFALEEVWACGMLRAEG